jgi:hypothetical protein
MTIGAERGQVLVAIRVDTEGAPWIIDDRFLALFDELITLEIAGRALRILMPIENWPGVARVYAARAKAHDRMGEEDATARDRQEQRRYDNMAKPEEEK